MNISVILAFLLSWSFVSSNPHQHTSNDKSVRELNHETDGGSDSSNLARTKSSDDASSGKDWGGNIVLNQDPDGTDKNDDGDDKSSRFISISEGSKTKAELIHEIGGGIKKMIGTSILKNESSDIPSNGEDLLDNNHNENILSSIQENRETLGKLFVSQNREAKESTSVDEETGKHEGRAKRDLGTSGLQNNPYKGSISEHLLKLSEGSTNNVLRSEKATVAEALNGHAIRKILEQAKAKSKVTLHKDLYDSNDFGKWLLSGSTFDTNNIFHHEPRQQTSQDAEVKEGTGGENTDDLGYRTFSTLHNKQLLDPNHRRHHRHLYYLYPRYHNRRHRPEGKYTFGTLSDRTTHDTADTEDSYGKLLHKSKHREHLSPKLQITSEEERDETGRMYRKPTALSRQPHRTLSYEDDTADDTGLQYYSRAYAPYIRFRVTEHDDAENGMPKWKWIRLGRARAPHFADSLEFDSSKDMDDYRKRYMFKSTFDGFRDKEAGGEEAGRREGHRISPRMDIYGINRDNSNDEKTELTASHGKTNWRDILDRKRYYYGIGDQEHFIYDDEADSIAYGGTKNRNLADFLVERTSPVDSRRGNNIRNKNKYLDRDGVERSAIYSTTSAETTGTAAGERSDNALTTKISMGTPTREAMHIDIEHYHSKDRNAVNTATSLSSGLSDEKGSERTNNALTSPSVDDGSAAERREATKSAGQSGVLRRTRPVIDNDATAAEIEMGFSGIKSHPRADLPWAHSSLSRKRSKTHLGNQGARRGISGHEYADVITSMKTEHSSDGGEEASYEHVKTQKNLSTSEDYADHDLEENEEVQGDAESSAKATSSAGSKHRYGILRTDSSSGKASREEDYVGIRKKQRVDLNGGRRNAGRHGTSVEMIDFPERSDDAYILIPEFPIYKFRRGHGPYDVNYYGLYDDQETEVGETARNLREGGISYDGWEQKEKFSADDKLSEKSTTADSNAHRSNSRQSQHGQLNEYAQQYNQYSQFNNYASDKFLQNMTWSSSIISDISEYEAWKRYITYLYYLSKKAQNSNLAFEASKLAIEESDEQDNAMDEEISLDRKHTTDEDNYIHLRKQKKWPQSAGKSMIKNGLGLKQDKSKLIKFNYGRTSNEDYRERGGEVISAEHVNNQREDHETLTRTGNVIREDSKADIMSKAHSNKKVINNDRYHQQGSWNSLLLENSRADARTQINGYESHWKNKNVGTNQAAETMESADSESNLRPTKTSSTSQSYAKSQMGEFNNNKSYNVNKFGTRTQASSKEIGYQDITDSRDTSVMSSELINKSQIRGMYRLKGKLRTDQKNSANMGILKETISSNDITDKSQSNVQRDKVAVSKLSAESKNGSEYYLENLENKKKHSINAGATSMEERQESISKDASSFSKSSVQSEIGIENYSNENARNIQISTINSGASSASSSKSFAKSKAKTEQMNNSEDINANAKASSIAMLSGKAGNELSTSSSKLSAGSRLKSDYYLTNHRANRINAISRSSTSSTLSNTVKDERQSQLQKSFSSFSPGKLQAESEYDPNSIQNSQVNAATAESSVSSLSNTENGYWSDSSKLPTSNLLEEAHQHNSNDIKMQESNIENWSELESTLSSKSHVRSKLKDKHYLSIAEDNENNIVNAGVSRATSSADIKDNHLHESISSSSASSSFAEVENRNNRKKSSMSNAISSSFVNDMEQRNLQRVQSSSHAASENDWKVQEDPRTISKSATFDTLTETNDNKRRQEDSAQQTIRFIGSENNLKTSASNEVIGKGETAKGISDHALNAATSATAVTFSDMGNMQNSMKTSSSIDSKAKTGIYSKNQLKEDEAIIGNSAVSRISATSGTSSENGDNDKNKLLKTSSLSESHSTLAEEKRRDMATTQNSQESMAATKASSEFTISNKNLRSRNEWAKESRSLALSEKTQQKQSNFNIRYKNVQDTASEATLMTSNNANNEYQDNILKGASSVVSYEESQTDDKLRNKNGAVARDSVEMSESATVRNNKHERLEHVSYDYHGGEHMESEISSRSDIKYPKHIGDVSKMISTGSVTSAVSSNANRHNPLKVISLDNLYAKSSQEDEDKSNIHSGAAGTASAEIISYDDKQARGNILRKLIFLSNPSDEAEMTHENNYDIQRKLRIINGNKEFKGHNLRNMSSNGLQVRDENVENTANANENIKDATDPSTSMGTVKVNFEGDYQDDPNAISIANVQDENQLESTSSIGTRAQSRMNQKSSISKRKNEISNTETRDMHNINKWHTKYYTTASSSSHAKTRDKSENTLNTKASAESISSKVDENSHEDRSTREKSLSISSGFHNYSDHQRTDVRNATKLRASAETSISNVSPIEYQDDAKTEVSAISQLKRHDLSVRDEDKEIASDVLQSAEETKFSGMQNTQQRKLSGPITSSNSLTEVQHEEISDFAKGGLEVAASAATSAQTASSETAESESQEKLIGVLSESDSYTKSQRGSKHSSNAISREEQVIANAKASADLAVSNNLESMRQSDWLKKDSLADRSHDAYTKFENENAVRETGSNLANIVDATSSTKESSHVIKDEHQSGVTTTALLSNSRAEAQEQRDCNSSAQQESIAASSGDTRDKVLKTENAVNGATANFRADANTITFDNSIFSSDVQDSSKTLSSANSYAESRADNTRTQTTASNKLRNMQVDKSLRTESSSDAYANAQTIDEHTNGIGEESSAVVNTRIATSTDIKGTDSHGLSNVVNAAGNEQETTNAEMSLVSASADAREKHTNNFMREKSNVDSQIRGMTKTENDGNMLQIDLRNSGNAEAWKQAASFSDVKNELQEGDEHESRVLQEQSLINADSTASSISKTFDHADSIQENNLKKLVATSSSNSYEKSNVESENRANVLAKDHMGDIGASTLTQATTSNKFGNTEEDESRQISSSDAYANAQTIDENSNGMGEDSSAAVNAKTETATSTDKKSANSNGLFDLLTGAATRMRTKGEAISREGAIKEDLSATSSGVFSGAGVESASARILTGNYENSATVNAIAETESGDQRDQQGDSRGTASSSSATQHSQLDVMKSTSSSANSYAAAQATSEDVAEEDPGVSISTLETAEARNQVKGAHPSGWLATTSDAGAVAEGRAQNKDKFNVLREVEEVAVYAGAADAGDIEGEQRDARVQESAEYQGGSNVATKIRHAAAASGASAATMTSMEMESESGSRSVSNDKMMASSFNEANAEARIRSAAESSVLRNSESSVDIERARSSTSASRFDNLGMSHRARYHQIDHGMSEIGLASKGKRLSPGEITVLYPSHEISKCDENVETREFISEASSLYQMLNKQRGSEILLIKKNPRGPVQIASIKNSVPSLIAYRLIPREVYERIRAIIARKQIFCADCALSSAKTRVKTGISRSYAR